MTRSGSLRGTDGGAGGLIHSYEDWSGPLGAVRWGRGGRRRETESCFSKPRRERTVPGFLPPPTPPVSVYSLILPSSPCSRCSPRLHCWIPGSSCGAAVTTCPCRLLPSSDRLIFMSVELPSSLPVRPSLYPQLHLRLGALQTDPLLFTSIFPLSPLPSPLILRWLDIWVSPDHQMG